jgi:hypothetical protein
MEHARIAGAARERALDGDRALLPRRKIAQCPEAVFRRFWRGGAMFFQQKKRASRGPKEICERRRTNYPKAQSKLSDETNLPRGSFSTCAGHDLKLEPSYLAIYHNFKRWRNSQRGYIIISTTMQKDFDNWNTRKKEYNEEIS